MNDKWAKGISRAFKHPVKYGPSTTFKIDKDEWGNKIVITQQGNTINLYESSFITIRDCMKEIMGL